MDRCHYILLGALLIALVAACTPESLEGFDENNSNSQNNANSQNNTNNSNTNNTNNGGTLTTEYIAVAGILRDNCLQAPCHGSAAANAFAVPSDQLATDEEIRQAIENVTANTSGMNLVVPGSSATSDIYDRMSRAAGEAGVMPQTGPLAAGDLTAIQAWIDGGAVYAE